MQGAVRHPTWSCSDGHPSGTGSARMMPLVFLNVGYSLVSSLKISCQSVNGQETSLSQLLLYQRYHHSPGFFSSKSTVGYHIFFRYLQSVYDLLAKLRPSQQLKLT